MTVLGVFPGPMQRGRRCSGIFAEWAGQWGGKWFVLDVKRQGNGEEGVKKPEVPNDEQSTRGVVVEIRQ